MVDDAYSHVYNNFLVYLYMYYGCGIRYMNCDSITDIFVAVQFFFCEKY